MQVEDEREDGGGPSPLLKSTALESLSVFYLTNGLDREALATLDFLESIDGLSDASNHVNSGPDNK
jgi:hypothetical protein